MLHDQVVPGGHSFHSKIAFPSWGCLIDWTVYFSFSPFLPACFFFPGPLPSIVDRRPGPLLSAAANYPRCIQSQSLHSLLWIASKSDLPAYRLRRLGASSSPRLIPSRSAKLLDFLLRNRFSYFPPVSGCLFLTSSS